jgi:hypothetical protein
MKRVVEIELGNQPLILTVQRPQEFPDFQTWRVAVYSHALAVMNRRGLTRDEVAEIGRLGPLSAFVQAALTENSLALWQGDDEPSVAFVNRRPVGDQLFYRILKNGGITSIKMIVDAFLSLYPDDEVRA